MAAADLVSGCSGPAFQVPAPPCCFSACDLVQVVLGIGFVSMKRSGVGLTQLRQRCNVFNLRMSER